MKSTLKAQAQVAKDMCDALDVKWGEDPYPRIMELRQCWVRAIEEPKEPIQPTVSIVIFLHSGKTFTFHNCSIQVSNEGMLIFNYVSAFDGVRKHFEAQRTNFVGHTVFPV